MDQSDILQIPQINPFQFDNIGNDIGTTVNLFRGDVNFFIPLVSFTGRNGLDVQVSALYRSNVQEQGMTRNLTAPTSILGLGWDLPVDYIHVETRGSGTQADNIYYFVRNETRNRLYRNKIPWLRGEIDSKFKEDLNNQKLSNPLYAALLSQGLRIDSSTEILVIKENYEWKLSDSKNEFELILAFNPEEDQIKVLDGGLSYELQGFDFSRIRYYVNFEKWEITYTNGITNVFGGNVEVSENGIKSSINQAIHWGVRMGNWECSSILTHQNGDKRIQEQYARNWYFTGSYTVWDDHISFEYIQVIQYVGSKEGLPYTKAAYISKITDVFGRVVEFVYQEKIYDPTTPQMPREYADPYKRIPNNDPDAFQSHYETKFLHEIIVRNELGELLYDIRFQFDLRRYAKVPASNDPLYGNTFKRILTNITKSLNTGDALPDVLFTYNGPEEVNPGAIQSVTYAEGCTAIYSYSKNELVNCRRDLKISNPIPGSAPRVWFGKDFAVVTWYNQGHLDVSIYTWMGRWQLWRPANPAVKDFINLNDLHCEIEDGMAILWYKNANGQSYAIYAYHKNPGIIGAWVELNQNPLRIQTTDCIVTSGEQFFVVADLINYKVNTFTWMALSLSWNEAKLPDFTPPSRPGDTALFLKGYNNVLTFLAYDIQGAPGQKHNRLNLYYLDDAEEWQLGESRIATEITIDQNNINFNFNWSMLPWSSIATYVTNDDAGRLEYDISIYQWDTNYKFLDPVTKSLSVTKSQPSSEITIPYIAQASPQGLVSSGPHLLRFNGAEWLYNDNLIIQQQVSDESIFWFAMGTDFVVKSENSEARVLGMMQVYDPNTVTHQWSNLPFTLFDSRPSEDRLISYFPSAASDYMTWNYDIYERETSTDWIQPLKAPVAHLPQGSDTTTLINAGPWFMVFLVKAPDGESILGTQVITLTNGKIQDATLYNERYFSLVNKDGRFVSNPNGEIPGNNNSFLTYLPITAPFDMASSITLRRYLGGTMGTPIVSYPVKQVTLADGFDKSVTHFEFDVDSAACDFQGKTTKYFKSTVYKGTKESEGYITYEFHNSLAGKSFNSENLTESTYLDGTLEKKTLYDGQNNIVSFTKSTFEVIKKIANSAGGNPDQPIYGAIVQLSETNSMKDGVNSKTKYIYYADSGRISYQTTSSFNSDGQPEIQKKITTFGYQAYISLWYLNNLGLTIQNTQTINVNNEGELAIISKVNTVKKWPQKIANSEIRLIPDVFETFIWLGGQQIAEFDFDRWSSGEGYSEHWLKTTSILIRSVHGLIVENESPIGRVESVLYDRLESAVVAGVSNASIKDQEAYYYGFEPYEQSGIWDLGDKTPISDKISYTGKHCLVLPPDTMGKGFRLTPVNQSRSYLFSCRAKTDKNYTPGLAGWKITLLEGSTPVDTLQLTFDKMDWTYYYKEIRLTTSCSTPITMLIEPYNKGGVHIFVDHVGFSPLNNPIHASVYDPLYYHVLAETGPYNNTLRRFFDGLGRNTGQTDSTDGIVRQIAYFLSRTVDGVFNPEEPNAIFNFQPMGDTYSDRFMNNGDYGKSWSTSTPSQWESNEGYMNHLGENQGELSFSRTGFDSNYIAQISIKSGTVAKSTGVKVGKEVTITWDPVKSQWSLVDHLNDKTFLSEAKSTTAGHQWTLALTDKTLLFLVDGRLIFSYPPTKMIRGAFSLFATGSISFHNFLIGVNPQVGVKYFDGQAKTRQGQMLEKGSATITQVLYDPEFRPAINTKPAVLSPGSNILMAYRYDAVTSFDWENGIMKGAIPEALPEDKGYPYTRKIFEPSPLGRTIEIGAPGIDFAITESQNDKTVKYIYTHNNSSDLQLPESEYYKTIREDQNGNKKVSLTDKFGRQIANQIEKEDGFLSSVVHLTYTISGRLKSERLPNYFNPPENSVPEDWVRSTQYNTRGQIVAYHDSNSGRTHYIYDENGLLRFSQNPVQADAGVVLYRKYDPDNRLKEEGYFPSQWDASTLQKKADQNQDWPGSDESTVIQHQYDYNGNAENANNLGHLTKVTTYDPSNNGVVALALSNQYNVRQKLCSETLHFISLELSFVIDYDYDNLGNVKRTSYPSGFSLQHIRDQIGRVIEIRDDSDQVLIEATYTPGDQLLSIINHVTQSDPIALNYKYNPQGWTTQIESPQLTENISYIKNGYDGAGYYDGSIASREVKLKIPEGSKMPADLLFKFRYDKAYRTEVAQCLLEGVPQAQWSLGLNMPISYDENGNFLMVDDERYAYEKGTDFAINTDGSSSKEFVKNKNGATISASPRGISSMNRALFSGKPVSIETNDNGILSFQYDQKNNRVFKKTESGSRIYCRNSKGSVIAEYKDSSLYKLPTDYLYGPGGLFGIKEDADIYSVQNDHLNSPCIVLNPQGEVISAYQYEAFGKIINQHAEQLLHFFFGGYELDQETGLYNTGARFYDPTLRRFYDVDPKMEYASPYVFVGNNPANLVDPDGESSWWAMLIGAVVGTIVTVATGGAGAILLGTEIAASAAVGAVAGAAGALVGDATTAGISGEPFTAKRALVDTLSGFAGGLVGAGVGGAAGRGAMNLAYNAGKNTAADITFVTRLGTSTSMITGGISGATASAAVSSGLTGQPFFSKETALNVAIGAIAGAGGALMASGAHFGFFGAMPIELGEGDFNRIKFKMDIGDNGQKLFTSVKDSEYLGTRNQIRQKYNAGDDAIFRMTPNGPEEADVIALHGVGRFVFPQTNEGYSQPMSGKLFARYIHQYHPYFRAQAYQHGPVPPLKLSICFSALPGRFGSVGQSMASALGRNTYTGRGIVYPANLAQNWIPFTP